MSVICLRFLRSAPRGTNTMLWIVCLAVLTVACRKEEIAVYTIPKETPPPQQIAASRPDSQGVHLHWVTPKGWQDQPTGGMRLANILVPGPDGRDGLVSIVELTGVVGQDLGVINIFRERLPGPPLTQTELAALGRQVQVGPTLGPLYDMKEEGVPDLAERGRLMVAVLPSPDSTWYVTFVGPDTLLERETPVFIEFLSNITIASGHAHSHSDATAIRADTIPDPRPALSVPKWTVPEGWVQTPASRLLLSRFEVNQDDGRLEVTVSAFPGEVGGTAANVNRWRGQIGLAPQSEAEINRAVTPLDVADGSAIVIDMTNRRDPGPVRLIGVIWARDEHTWFYKMSGDEPVVNREKSAFLEFVWSVRYP